jgi:hypothetical protein
MNCLLEEAPLGFSPILDAHQGVEPDAFSRRGTGAPFPSKIPVGITDTIIMAWLNKAPRSAAFAAWRGYLRDRRAFEIAHGRAPESHHELTCWIRRRSPLPATWH